MKNLPSSPRIVLVASRIASIQTKLASNNARIETLNSELARLGKANGALVNEQLSLQRELDKLAVGPVVQP